MNFNRDEKRYASNYKPNAVVIGENYNHHEFLNLLDTEVLMTDSVSSLSSYTEPEMNGVAFVPCNMELIHRSFFSDASCIAYYIDNKSPAAATKPSVECTTAPCTSSIPSFRYTANQNTPCVMIYSADSNTKSNGGNSTLTPHSDKTFSAISPRCSDPRSFSPAQSVSRSPHPISDISTKPIANNTKRKLNTLSVEDIIAKKRSISQLIHLGLIDRLISDQNGSRYLQRALKASRNAAEVSLMIRYCIDKLDLVKLSEDVYGNYIVQLFFMKTNEIEQQLLLKTVINDNFFRLSKSIYGCRVVQKCLSCVKNKRMLCDMLRSFDEQSRSKGALSKALVCPYTNHVIQAMLDLKLDSEYVDFIKRELERSLSFYCEHIIGCRIVQCFIKNYGDKLNVLKLICDDRHLYLSKTKYGNYVIQCIIARGLWYSDLGTICAFRNKMIEDVFHEQNVLYLSKNKFGSNVVEQCIKTANEKQRSFLVEVFARNHYIIPAMINHCYGNYVVRALLSESSKKNQISVIKSIRFYCTNNIIIKKDLVKEMNRIRTKYQI